MSIEFAKLANYFLKASTKEIPAEKRGLKMAMVSCCRKNGKITR